MKPEMFAAKDINTPDPQFLLSLDGLPHWEKARYEKDLSGLKVYWLSDQVGDSLIPDNTDQNLFPRFEELARSLDEIFPHSDNTKEADNEVFTPCFRDAAALTVALAPYRSFILTLHGRGNRSRSREQGTDEPFICSYLKARGIHCEKVDSEKMTRLEREYIAPILARSGISELLWAGMRLAGVHILAPEASVMPLSINGEEAEPREYALWNNGKAPEKKSWWKGAISFWYSLWPD
jgi:hypothetical protein